MHRIDSTGAFDFDDDLLVDDQIRAIATDDVSVEFDVELGLAIDPKAGLAEENGEPIRVDGLEKPGAELVV